jgi:N-acyl-phosphatidylethanolamine-hydrolysing phospholipase D
MQKRTRRPPFRNLHPHSAHDFRGVVRWKLGLAGSDPATQTPPRPDHRLAAAFARPAAEAPETVRVRAVWIGHSTFLLQHEGLNILTDPIFGDCQPLPVGRLRRSCAPGMRLAELPPIQHVLISHSHYDHLDAPAIRAILRRNRQVQFWLPEGLSGWFHRRGIRNCTELAWGQSAPLSDTVSVHSVPAQHGSARTLFDRNRTHWCGWVLTSASRSVYFAGDTGYAPIFREIGKEFDGFDLALIPIGCYNPRWLMHPVHLNPAEAVQVHLDVLSRQSIACHWGTFRLADEPLGEPPVLLAQEVARAGIAAAQFRAIQPGESIDV